MRSTKVCKSPQCSRRVTGAKHPISRQLKPISMDIVGIHTSRRHLLIEDLHSPLQLYHMLLRQAGEGQQRPNTVILCCCSCKERTKPAQKLGNKENSFYVDNNARWTYGTYRPLYLVPSSKCLNCNGGRLVPHDTNIPFISNKALTNIQRMFGVYPMVIKEALLDPWPSESHDERELRQFWKANSDLPTYIALYIDGILRLLQRIKICSLWPFSYSHQLVTGTRQSIGWKAYRLHWKTFEIWLAWPVGGVTPIPARCR